MKKRNLLILLISLFVLVASFSIYAAFTMTNSYDAEQDFHKIDATGSVDPQSANIEFNAPGDIRSITYTINNPTQNDIKLNKHYEYEFILDGDGSYNKLYDMIFVYSENKYLGTLSDYVSNKENNQIAKPLPISGYVLSGQTETEEIKLELHNASTGFGNSLNVNLNLQCILKTINVSKTLVVTSDISTESVDQIFKRTIQDVNAYKITADNLNDAKTIVLGVDVHLQDAMTIENTSSIDLNGHKLTLSQPLTIKGGLDSSVERIVDFRIYDSKGTGSVINANNINLNSTNAILTPDVMLDGALISQFSVELLKSKISDKLNEKDNIILESNLLDGYLCYLNKGKISLLIDGQANTTGIYTVPTQQPGNEAVKIDIPELTLKKNLRTIGSNDAVLNEIFTKELLHLEQFKTVDNGKTINHDLFLPGALRRYNATIDWNSNREDVMTSEGIAVKGQGDIVLTATIKYNNKVHVQKYYLRVEKESNLSKLRAIAAAIENKIKLRNGLSAIYFEGNPSIDSYFDLPVADPKSPNYYADNVNWKLKNYGIASLTYEVDAGYSFLGLGNHKKNPSDQSAKPEDLLDAPFVKLISPTFAENGRLILRGDFGGEICETYVNVKIKLSQKQLEDSIYKVIKDEIDKVDILKLIIASREADGILNQSAKFTLPTVVNGFTIKYEISDKLLTEMNGLYLVSGGEISIDDFTKLPLTDTLIPIKASIMSDGNPTSPKNLYFNVPGALTYKKAPGNIVGDDSKNIFTSIMYQTYLDVGSQLFLDKADPTQIANVKSFVIPENKEKMMFLLMNDVLNIQKLVFEYRDKNIIIESENISALESMLNWAISNKKLTFDKYAQENNISDVIDQVDSQLLWISSDGLSSISDSEAFFILEYAERYIFFKDLWNAEIKILDNILTNDDINNLKDTIAEDKDFIEIINWITSTTLKSLSKVITSNILPGEITSLTNDALASVSNDEEKVIILYVQSKYFKTEPQKYTSFINAWHTSINREDRSIDGNEIRNLELGTLNLGDKYKVKSRDIILDKLILWSQEPNTVNPLSFYLDNLTKLTEDNGLFTAAQTAQTNKVAGVDSGGTGVHITSQEEWNIIYGYIKTNYIDSGKIQTQKVIDTLATINSANFNTAKSDKPAVNGLTVVAHDKWGWPIPFYSYSYKVNPFVWNDVIVEINKCFDNSFDTIANDKLKEWNGLLSWATAADDKVITNSSITSITAKSLVNSDSNTVCDFTKYITYEEFEALVEYYEKYIAPIFNNLPIKVKTVLLDYYFKNYSKTADEPLKMAFTDKDISTSDKSNMLNIIVNDFGLSTLIENSKKLYRGSIENIDASLKNDYDLLPTISKNELQLIVNKLKGNLKDKVRLKGALLKLEEILPAYTIDKKSFVVKEVKTDRIIDDLPGLIAKVNQNISSETTNSKGEKYLSISIVDTEAEIEVLESVRNFENLTKIIFRGNGSKYLFGSNIYANRVFNSITMTNKKLTYLAFEKAGLSKIDGVEEAVNLSHLSIKGNKTKGEFKGVLNISQLLTFINNKKKNEPINQGFDYLNVYDIDAVFGSDDIVINKIYDGFINNGVHPKIYYTVDGVETLFSRTLAEADYRDALLLSSFLHEIKTITTDLLVLPSTVRGKNVMNEMIKGNITWSIYSGDQYVSLVNNRIIVNQRGGRIVLAAKVVKENSMPNTEVIRYFICEIPNTNMNAKP